MGGDLTSGVYTIKTDSGALVGRQMETTHASFGPIPIVSYTKDENSTWNIQAIVGLFGLSIGGIPVSAINGAVVAQLTDPPTKVQWIIEQTVQDHLANVYIIRSVINPKLVWTSSPTQESSPIVIAPYSEHNHNQMFIIQKAQ